MTATIQLPNAVKNLIDSLAEEGDLVAALATLNGIIGPYAAPDAAQIRQLLTLALSPTAHQQNPSIPHPDERTRMEKERDPTADGTSIGFREKALGLLRDVVRSNGVALVDGALPGYAPSSAFDPPPTTTATTGKSTTLRERKSAPTLPVAQNNVQQFKIEPDDSPLAIAGKKLGKSLDIWTVLAGTAMGGTRKGKGKEVLGEGGWNVLEALVGMWEFDAASRAEGGQPKISPSLLRQFATTPEGPRVISNQVLSMIFHPFLSSSVLSIEEDSVEGEDMMEVEGTEGDALSEGEKCGVAARLMGLLGNLAAYGHLVGVQSIMDVMTRLKELRSDRFGDFVDRISQTTPLFTNRLATYYLSTFSHLPLTPPQPMTNNPSPSRASRPLSAHSSLVPPSQSQPSSSSSSTAPVAGAVVTIGPIAYFVPSLRSSTLIDLLGKIPREIPRDTTTGELVRSGAMGKEERCGMKGKEEKEREEVLREVVRMGESMKEALVFTALLLDLSSVRDERKSDRDEGKREGELCEVLRGDETRRRVGAMIEEALS